MCFFLSAVSTSLQAYESQYHLLVSKYEPHNSHRNPALKDSSFDYARVHLLHLHQTLSLNLPKELDLCLLVVVVFKPPTSPRLYTPQSPGLSKTGHHLRKGFNPSRTSIRSKDPVVDALCSMSVKMIEF
ncbi:hypothetical protein Tco_0344381 [Tanacetum coccineum]